jgi:hypothetical protein
MTDLLESIVNVNVIVIGTASSPVTITFTAHGCDDAHDDDDDAR